MKTSHDHLRARQLLQKTIFVVDSKYVNLTWLSLNPFRSMTREKDPCTGIKVGEHSLTRVSLSRRVVYCLPVKMFFRYRGSRRTACYIYAEGSMTIGESQTTAPHHAHRQETDKCCGHTGEATGVRAHVQKHNTTVAYNRREYYTSWASLETDLSSHSHT